MQTPSNWYNNHPYGTRPVRKQARRKVQWRTSAQPFDPNKVALAYR